MFSNSPVHIYHKLSISTVSPILTITLAESAVKPGQILPSSCLHSQQSREVPTYFCIVIRAITLTTLMFLTTFYNYLRDGIEVMVDKKSKKNCQNPL